MSAPLPRPDERFSGLIGGKYRVISTIAVGGMGVVYQAENVRTSGRVALKVLSDEAKRDDASRLRFAREARASGRLRSRHVARVLDVDTLDDETPYIVMELLDGNDLSRELKQRPPLPLDEAASIVVQVAAGVAEAHAAGIVHRDLKPGNVFLAREGSQRVAKVLDFGISKVPVEGEDASELTCTFATVGTPAYMSPEQIRSPRDVDAATDVWSLGVLLHRLLAGRVPFTGNASSVAVSICNDTPPALSTVRDDLPEDVIALVDAALQKDKSRRPSIAALAEGLAAHLGEGPQASIARDALAEIHHLAGSSASTTSSAGTAGAAAAPAIADDTVADPQLAVAIERTQVSPWKKRAVAGCALAVIAAGIFAVVRARPTSNAVAPATETSSSSAPVVASTPIAPSNEPPSLASAAPAPSGSSPVTAKAGVGSKPSLVPRPKPTSNATATAAPLPPRL